MIHLKRFAYSENLRKKILDKVECPITLDLGGFSEAEKCKYGRAMEAVKLTIVELFGVILHAGSFSNCGHYACIVRNSAIQDAESVVTKEIEEENMEERRKGRSGRERRKREEKTDTGTSQNHKEREEKEGKISNTQSDNIREWMYIDDEEVNFLDEDRLKTFLDPSSASCNAIYILFYRRIRH